MGSTTTVDFPAPLPVERRGDHWVARSDDRELKLTNLDKVYWPKEGYTKGDLLTYYFNVSPTMLPHIEDRPLTLKRMPNGVDGDFFYEKNAPKHKPKWMPTVPVPSDEGEKIINFLAVYDPVQMLWVANLGCIEFHPLHGRAGDKLRPSYAFFDLDPFEPAGWPEVAHVALVVKLALQELGLQGYPKTSGATGMQIMVPLDGNHDYGEIRGFVGAVSDLIHKLEPKTTTLEWDTSKRSGKVFLDVNMNRAGANIAAAYSVRPEPGATVSAPLQWDEIDSITPSDFTIETIFDRIADAGDPFLPVAEGPGQSLTKAIEVLGATPRRARVIRR